MGTRRVDSNVVANLTCLALPYQPVFYPTFLHSLTHYPEPKNITSPSQTDPTQLSLPPSLPLARVLLVPGWITEALPLVPPRGWVGGNSNSNAANAQRLGTGLRDGGSQSAAPLARIIGCRLPSMRWNNSPENTLLFC